MEVLEYNAKQRLWVSVSSNQDRNLRLEDHNAHRCGALITSGFVNIPQQATGDFRSETCQTVNNRFGEMQSSNLISHNAFEANDSTDIILPIPLCS